VLRGILVLALSVFVSDMAFAGQVQGVAAPGTLPRPLVMGHRGASGYVPDHTIVAYERAIEQGADYIETDLVRTRDGYLIARHENELSATTNIADMYPDRKTKKNVDGKTVEGWFSEDFTLDELGIVRSRQPMPFRDQTQNDKYPIPTIAEVLVLRASKSRELGRTIGVYIEAKHPAYFRAQGRPIEEGLVSILRAWALDRPGSPVFLQAFDPAAVKRFSSSTSVPAIQLLSESADVSDAALANIATYAKGIGPAKTMIVPVDKQGQAGKPTDLVVRAHKAGLLVHPYTFRPEKPFLPVTYGGDPAKEYCQFKQLGVDGVFTDTPDLALKAFTESCPMSK